MRRKLAVFLALVAITGASCGGDDTPALSGSPPATTSDPTTTPGLDCEDLTAGPTFELVMANTRFDPACLSVRNTQNATVINEDPFAHNWTIQGANVNLDFAAGEEKQLEAIGGMVPPGSYVFLCRFHQSSGMVGTITVQ
jgi:plastocyanin